MIKFKGFLILAMVVAGLARGGPGWAAPRETGMNTEIRVDRGTSTLTVLSRDRELTVSVRPAADHGNPVIEIAGWGPDGRYRVAASDTAPVIFIDLYGVLPGFPTAVLPVDVGWVTHLRVGHHSDRLRIALDGRHPDLPRAEAVRRNGILVITLDGGNVMEKQEIHAPGDLKPLAQISELPSITQARPVEPDPDPAEKQAGKTSSPAIRQSLGHAGDSDTTPEGRLFQEALALFDNRQWAMARNKAQQIMTRYPDTPYGEKAGFLMADILTSLYAGDPAAHFRELSAHFQDILNRYPESAYRGGALLGLARLHRLMGNHAEALAYYELARNSVPDKKGAIYQQSLLDTAKIYQATGRVNQALLLLEDLLAATDIGEIKDGALLETAKIRYDQGFYNESLNLLTQLTAGDNGFYFQIPEVSLYFGNNNFQLGRYDRAIHHLLHHYNAVPRTPGKEMILARVGDAYLQEGRVMDAVRCFQFLVDRYPDTRAAAIGWLRLAEQKERHPDERIPVSYSARQIYENIRDDHQGQPIDDPLALLAILKLAVLYHDEKRYDESLETLALFFKNNPDRSLLENGRFALKNVLEDMILTAYEEKDYKQVITLYTRKAGPVIPLMDPDPVLVAVARAYRHSGNSAAALDLYHTLAASIPLDKAPDDVLFFAGKAQYGASDPDKAEKNLSRLISVYPQSPFAGEAMSLMGRILTARGKYREAVAVMTRALSHSLPPCDRASLLVQTARTAWQGQDKDTTLSTLESARKAIDACPSLAGYLGDQIGDLYVEAGVFDQAASMFARVLDMGDPKLETGFVQYKNALSLWRAGDQDAAQALFETLAAQEDPFWSRLAQEHLGGIRFDQAVR